MLKCPQCNSNNIADILFGMPSFSEDLLKKKNEGKIVFGGCVIDENFNPELHCNKCKYQWDKSRPGEGRFKIEDVIDE
tara:strand:+ start:210 stop:443 length:234 start_codon:yes stop_codon:yes gene_type:complete